MKKKFSQAEMLEFQNFYGFKKYKLLTISNLEIVTILNILREKIPLKDKLWFIRHNVIVTLEEKTKYYRSVSEYWKQYSTVVADAANAYADYAATADYAADASNTYAAYAAAVVDADAVYADADIKAYINFLKKYFLEN